MNIAYRRMSGPIGVTDHEKGQRGLWWEKRRGLVAALRARGHRVDYLSRFTKLTAECLGQPARLHKHHDLLMLEFGSTNKVFYRHDLEVTSMVLGMHRGPVIFLCDDPDLPFPWRDYSAGLNWRQWTVWANATRGDLMGMPMGVRYQDLPFASLLEHVEPAAAYGDRAVYLGRPNGRKPAIQRILGAQPPVRWSVFGRQQEWDRQGLPRVTCSTPPEQPQRAAFYARQRASLVLADARHKRLGWRTGRAFHAILAGCPAIVEHDHPTLSAFAAYEHPRRINEYLDAWTDPAVRAAEWSRQIAHVQAEKALAGAAFARAGL